MGLIREHTPALRIVAISTRYKEALDWISNRSQTAWGPIALASPWFDFNQTDYYQASMGTDLKKMFLAFQRPMDPADLVAAKHATNRWESAFKSECPHPEARPINLDPGYINAAKLVLASTKDHAHRIYLNRGIYAEITLYYSRRQWCSHAWTYPDYRQPAFHAFFDQCRDFLRSHSR